MFVPVAAFVRSFQSQCGCESDLAARGGADCPHSKVVVVVVIGITTKEKKNSLVASTALPLRPLISVVVLYFLSNDLCLAPS